MHEEGHPSAMKRPKRLAALGISADDLCTGGRTVEAGVATRVIPGGERTAWGGKVDARTNPDGLMRRARNDR